MGHPTSRRLFLQGILACGSLVATRHQHAAGAHKKGDQALGRSRGGLSTKTHTVSVSESQVLGLILPPVDSPETAVNVAIAAEAKG